MIPRAQTQQRNQGPFRSRVPVEMQHKAGVLQQGGFASQQRSGKCFPVCPQVTSSSRCSLRQGHPRVKG